MNRHKFYRAIGKRILDVLFSLVALFVLSPFLAVIAVLVRIKLGSPVIFTQQRIGKGEKFFSMYKFRSMSMEVDQNGQLLPDAQRLTAFGKLLRTTSVDELPALLNILKGEMSLIGPRPLPEAYLQYFQKEERLRHTVRGGLTGLAQINGRNNLSWEERFAYDVKYVENLSLKQDVIIFFKTIRKVLMRDDVGVRGVVGPGDLYAVRKSSVEENIR